MLKRRDFRFPDVRFRSRQPHTDSNSADTYFLESVYRYKEATARLSIPIMGKLMFIKMVDCCN